MEPLWIVDTNASISDQMVDLYPHQQKAIQALNEYFQIPSIGVASPKSGLLIMPTGSGKTFTAVQWLFTEAMANGYKIIWLVHRKELMEQASAEFRRCSPIMYKYNKDKVKAILVSSQHFPVSSAKGYDLTIGSSLSVGSKRGLKYIKSALVGQQGKEKLIVVIDEAHHAVSKTNRLILERIREKNPNVLLLGLTATPTRISDNEKRELAWLFDVQINRNQKIGTENGFIYECKMIDLIVSGFLATPVFNRIETALNAEIEYGFDDEQKEWLVRHGELSESLISKIATTGWRNHLIVDEYIKHQSTYGKTLVFAVNQFHARMLTELFLEKGIACDYCISDEPNSKASIAAFKSNQLRVLVNVQILTEGSDIPDIQTIFLTRSTMSDSLLMQMIGRGLRGPAAKGTEKAYIVDFHDNWGTFQDWLDPKELLAGELNGSDTFPENEVAENNEQQKIDDIDEDASRPSTGDVQELSGLKTLYDRMVDIYKSMIIDASVVEQENIVPYGWFSIIEGENEDRILVYESQADGFDAIARDAKRLAISKPSLSQIARKYFDTDESTPEMDALKAVIDHLYESGQLPLFTSFEYRDLIDINMLARTFLFEKRPMTEIDLFAQDIYLSEPVIREIYTDAEKLSSCLKIAVLVLSGKSARNEPIVVDDRAEYRIIPDYHNLGKIMNDILKQFNNKVEFKNKSRHITIRWSTKPWRSRFGLCKQISADNEYDIVINSLLSSPLVDEAVVASVVHHELLHAYGYWKHNDEFRKYEWKFKDMDLMDIRLDTLFQDYNMDPFAPPRKRKYLEVLDTNT